MRTELLQKIESHMEFLGYETKWNKMDDENEIMFARHSTKPDYLCYDLMGMVTLVIRLGKCADRKRMIDFLNTQNGMPIMPFRMSIDEEGILKFSTFLTSYEKVGFAKQLDLCENSLKIFFADEDVKKLIGIS